MPERGECKVRVFRDGETLVGLSRPNGLMLGVRIPGRTAIELLKAPFRLALLVLVALFLCGSLWLLALAVEAVRAFGR